MPARMVNDLMTFRYRWLIEFVFQKLPDGMPRICRALVIGRSG